MLTTRKAELDPDNKLTLTTKTDIELSNAKRKSLNMGTTQDDIKQIRETWADLANHALERAGYRRKNRPPQLCRSEQWTTSHHS